MFDGWTYWREKLHAARLVVAPMVDASELAWRELSRKHGAQLCYTPMIHSCIFSKDAKYRKEAFETCATDRPLIVQFCGNDPEILLKSARLVEDSCDGIDINLGCPQAIAKKGHYGAFLQDEWELLANIVKTLSQKLKVPVSCKIRIFDDVERSIKYATMLEESGCSLLTVHGRTREQKGPLTGVADWHYIKAIRESVGIPVFANGNIQCLNDVERCIMETGVQGVMSAEGSLYNPFIFDGVFPAAWEPALEYLEQVKKFPCPNSFIRGHLFKIFHHLLSLPENANVRTELGSANKLEQFEDICNVLKTNYEPYHNGEKVWVPCTVAYDLELPPWICHSYVRQSPEMHVKMMEEKKREQQDGEFGKRSLYMDADGREISRKRMKKLRRLERRPTKPKMNRACEELCQKCPNPMALKCDNNLCKRCCRIKHYVEKIECVGHKFFSKLRSEMLVS